MGWTARGHDAVRRDREGILDRIRRGLRAGAIVLVHDARVGGDRGRDFTVTELLEDVLDLVRAEGYVFGGGLNLSRTPQSNC